ncbi:DUF5983 family protein [Ralstonia pseudosolanacearum]|uniref:DUF5983 family protein n=1 Tax=Ralstonia pseudosolanacearum TaxID=1310165 RepID=UPI004053C248
MSDIKNPFVRGYQNLRVQRSLCIVYEDDCPPVWRPLHPSQAHLHDTQIALFPCIFNNDFTLITEGQIVPDDLEARCPSDGVVRLVTYAIMADDIDDNFVHVGDVYSEADARERVQRLQFETGFYSQCWEISAAHITTGTWSYLAHLADIATPTDFLFIAFHIPYSPAIGVKLIATPWTDLHLQQEENTTVDQLRLEHSEKGVPGDLSDVLHLAAEADVRILIFDTDAPVLAGIPVYDGS